MVCWCTSEHDPTHAEGCIRLLDDEVVVEGTDRTLTFKCKDKVVRAFEFDNEKDVQIWQTRLDAVLNSRERKGSNFNSDNAVFSANANSFVLAENEEWAPIGGLGKVCINRAAESDGIPDVQVTIII